MPPLQNDHKHVSVSFHFAVSIYSYLCLSQHYVQYFIKNEFLLCKRYTNLSPQIIWPFNESKGPGTEYQQQLTSQCEPIKTTCLQRKRTSHLRRLHGSNQTLSKSNYKLPRNTEKHKKLHCRGTISKIPITEILSLQQINYKEEKNRNKEGSTD